MPPQHTRIALYSHDSMGLGHMRRNMLLAEELASSPLQPSVLLISGSREIARFGVTRGIDVVSLPSLYKDESAQYHARWLDIPFRELVALRSSTILGALKSFDPDVFVVDNVPRGAGGELDAALEHMRRRGRTRCVLGLRDILDDARDVRLEWGKAENFAAVRRNFDAIWVYGDKSVTDTAVEYDFPVEIARRIRYTGFLDQRVRSAAATDPTASVSANAQMVLCMLGGGQDGLALAESFIAAELPAQFRKTLVTGPMMASEQRDRLYDRAATEDHLCIVEFLNDPAAAMRASHSVITMGGYNTVCDVLSHGPRALIVPRVTPRTEQLIRATRLADRGLLDMLHPAAATPAALSTWICGHDRRTGRQAVRMHTTAGLHGLLDDAMALDPAVRLHPARALEVRHAS